MATAVERLELLITGNAKDAVAAFRQTELAAKGLDGQTTTTATTMRDKLGGAATAVGQHFRQNIGFYSVAAVGALAAAGGAAIKEYTTLADKVRDFSRASGASADTSSRLVAIFDDLEVSQKAADTGFFRLNRTIHDNKDALEQYGVKVKTAKDGTTDIYGTLLSVADAYRNAGDSGTRMALVQEAFGRGGKDLIPILEQGRAGIERLFAEVPTGQILDQGEVDRAREFELAVDDLQDAFMELKVAAGSAIVPVLTTVSSGLAGAVRTADQASSSVGGLSTVLGYASTAFNPLYLGSNLASGAMNLLSGNVGDAAKSFAHAIPGVGSLADKFGLGSKETDKFADSQKRLAEAQQEVARLAADENATQKDRREAQRELNDAKDEYEGITRRVVKALGDENDQLEKQRQKMDAAYASAVNYANSQLGVEGAALNVRSAQERYNEVLNDSKSSQLDVDEATNRLLQSYVGYGDAVFKANKTAGDTTEEAKTKQIESLAFVAGTLAEGSPLKQNLNDYIYRLAFGVPRDVETRLRIIGTKSASASLVGDVLAAAGSSIGALLAAVPVGATGGIVNRPTLALIGEAGPEAVVPLNRTPGNGPLPGDFGTQSAGPQTIVIPVHVGGRQVAEVVASELNRPGGPKITQKALVA